MWEIACLTLNLRSISDYTVTTSIRESSRFCAAWLNRGESSALAQEYHSIDLGNYLKPNKLFICLVLNCWGRAFCNLLYGPATSHSRCSLSQTCARRITT